MKHRERLDLMVWGTVCGTLTLGTVAVLIYGPSVNKEVSLALIVQWGVLLAAAMKREQL